MPEPVAAPAKAAKALGGTETAHVAGLGNEPDDGDRSCSPQPQERMTIDLLVLVKPAFVVDRAFHPPPADSGRDERVLSIQVDADGPSTLARSKVCDSPVFAGSQGELDLAPQVDSPLRNPPITLEWRPAPRAEALIGEQLSQRSGGQQSPTALEAGEWCHEAMLDASDH